MQRRAVKQHSALGKRLRRHFGKIGRHDIIRHTDVKRRITDTQVIHRSIHLVDALHVLIGIHGQIIRILTNDHSIGRCGKRLIGFKAHTGKTESVMLCGEHGITIEIRSNVARCLHQRIYIPRAFAYKVRQIFQARCKRGIVNDQRSLQQRVGRERTACHRQIAAHSVRLVTEGIPPFRRQADVRQIMHIFQISVRGKIRSGSCHLRIDDIKIPLSCVDVVSDKIRKLYHIFREQRLKLDPVNLIHHQIALQGRLRDHVRIVHLGQAKVNLLVSQHRHTLSRIQVAGQIFNHRTTGRNLRGHFIPRLRGLGVDRPRFQYFRFGE